MCALANSANKNNMVDKNCESKHKKLKGFENWLQQADLIQIMLKKKKYGI